MVSEAQSKHNVEKYYKTNVLEEVLLAKYNNANGFKNLILQMYRKTNGLAEVFFAKYNNAYGLRFARRLL